MNNVINFLSWVKQRQRAELDLTKRSHMATIIKFHNLIERQALLGRTIKSQETVNKIG